MIEFKTGRVYDGKDQVIRYKVVDTEVDAEFDLYTHTVLFEDEVRNISGEMILLSFDNDPRTLGPSVLDAYDRGRYSLTISEDAA